MRDDRPVIRFFLLSHEPAQLRAFPDLPGLVKVDLRLLPAGRFVSSQQ